MENQMKESRDVLHLQLIYKVYGKPNDRKPSADDLAGNC